jgi:hexosaminidase
MAINIKSLFLSICALCLMIFFSCASDNSETAKNDNGLHITHEVQEVDLGSSTSVVNWTIINKYLKPLPKTGWSIYFNQIAMIIDNGDTDVGLVVENVKGDYQRIYPDSSFTGLNVGDSLSFSQKINYPILRKTFTPSSLYIAYDNGYTTPIENVTHIPFSDEVKQNLNSPSAADIYKKNKLLSVKPKTDILPISPKPKSYKKEEGTLNYSGTIHISSGTFFRKEAVQLKDYLSEVFTGSIFFSESSNDEPDNTINLIKSDDVDNPSAYQLSVSNKGISIRASHQQGIFYGIQSLRHLIANENYTNPSNEISIQYALIDDEARFNYRGLMIDVSRNFHSKEAIFKTLDLMAFFKLNKFHFHLTDDEGWRLEIDGLPELTDIGAKRGHTTDESDMLYPFYSSGPDAENSYGSGFYSKADFIEILQYANDRHIEVIPEIDLPGHMRAAIIAMTARYNRLKTAGDENGASKYLLEDFDDESVYSSAQGYNDNAMCVCRESAFTFIEKVVEELVNLYDDAGIPLKVFHSGGDEVAYGAWQKSPVCEKFIAETEDLNSSDDLHAYTLNRLKAILAKHDIKSAGWEEILLKHGADGHNTTEINTDFLGDNMRAYVWNAIWGGGREEMAYKLANLGYEVVISNSAQLYLDMAYNTDPEETGLSWSGYTDTKSAFDLVPLDIYKTAGVSDIDNFVKGKTPLTEKGKTNILGIQGQIWSETIRSEELLFYMMFPKLISVAERAWSPEQPWESEPANNILNVQQSYWNDFTNTLGHYVLPKLDVKDVSYRIPPPGAVVENGQLSANTLFPGLTIRYTTDGSIPTEDSQEYISPIKIIENNIVLKTFSSNGRSSRAVKLN